MAKFDLTPRAIEDLYSIWDYSVTTWSEDQADKYFGQLDAGMNEIADSPLSIGKAYDEIRPGLLGYRVRKHIVFYTIRPNGRVLIARILHESMDFPSHF